MDLTSSLSKCRCGAPLKIWTAVGQDRVGDALIDAGALGVSRIIGFSQYNPSKFWRCRGALHASNPLSQSGPGWKQESRRDASRLISRQMRHTPVAHALKINRPSTPKQNELERGNGDDEACPLECVKEIYSQEELRHHLEEAGPHSLVVVDFFRTACGSCRYIEKGFMKLCKGESEDEEEGGQHHVVFLKHNVMNEYDEQSDIAEDLRIKVVPLFHFYKGGKLVDSFATRDKNRLLATIYQHTNRESEIPKLSQA